MQLDFTEISLLDKYNKEITDYLKINEVNIKEKALSLPAYKHYWTSRLIYHKRKLQKLEKQKKQIFRKTAEVVKNQAAIEMSNKALTQAVSATDVVSQIQSTIDEETLVIEYLERVEKIMSSATWDIKNIVDLIKLETT